MLLGTVTSGLDGVSGHDAMRSGLGSLGAGLETEWTSVESLSTRTASMSTELQE